MHVFLSLTGLALLASLGGCAHAERVAEEEPSAVSATIYENARVITQDPARPTASGLRIEAGRITHVFEGAAPADLTGRRVDLEGAVVLPGLVDAHQHLLMLGATASQVDLVGVPDAGVAAERVREAAAGLPPGTWIRGRGWDQNDWPGDAFPTREVLDAAAPDHPVWLVRVDGHAVWLNSAALTLTGIDADTPDPEGGEILRDASGRPTGILVDNAIDLAEKTLPPPTEAELRRDLEQGMAEVRALGLTGVHDMGTTPEALAVLRQLEAEGRLTVRYTAYLYGTEEELAPLLAEGPDREGLLRVVGVKLFADGALGSRGAALLEPYSDRPDTSGLLLAPREALTERARGLHAEGWQLAIHAIGDRGNRVALDAIEAAQGEGPRGRHRVEHAQIVAPEDLPRFAALDAVASMQPTHATTDMDWVGARLGEERLAGAYAWRTLQASGAVLAFGSDAPVEPANPWYGIHAAVTRRNAENRPEGGWRMEEALTVEDALRAFTLGAARAAGDEDLGVLRPGAVADLTVVDRDPRELDPLALRRVRTLRTVVDGREVYTAAPGEAGGEAAGRGAP